MLSEKARENKRRYNHEYQKKHYKRVLLLLTPSEHERIKSAADNASESVNGYIKKATLERISRESPDDTPTGDN